MEQVDALLFEKKRLEGLLRTARKQRDAYVTDSETLTEECHALRMKNSALHKERDSLVDALKAVLSHPHGQPLNDALHRARKAARAAIAASSGIHFTKTGDKKHSAFVYHVMCKGGVIGRLARIRLQHHNHLKGYRYRWELVFADGVSPHDCDFSFGKEYFDTLKEAQDTITYRLTGGA